MIETRNLTRRFGDVTAVDALTLTVESGEVFGLLGPNGAGKTTTVRMLTALIAPTSGEARVAGYWVGTDNMDIRRMVGLLTETPGFYENLSAAFNLQVFAELYEVPDPKKQVEKYLRLLDLWERRDDPVGAFSKGMKQKLALARALLHEPRVLFLDEPTSGLDPEAARLVRAFIADLRAEGRTIILCSHNLDEVERLCDRVAVLKTRLLVVDTPTHLRQALFGRRVVIHLSGPAEPWLSALEGLPFLRERRAVDDKLLLQLDDPDAQNPQVIRALVQAGAEVRFVGELRHSLEDVYLHLLQRSEKMEAA